MLRSKYATGLLTILMIAWAAIGGAAQEIERYDGDDQPMYYSDRPGIDRYLDAEVWVDHADGEYYIGDDIGINFRVSRDAFVAIYTVDSRGLVNLLFPSDPSEDNFVRGGETYQLPGPRDNYDLVVSGPEGMENIQIIASRERFPIPSWYGNSGLVCDWDDRYEFMDYVNGKYFIRYDGQRFAYDRAVIFVNEWEEYYFRPVYYPTYPSWSVSGNVYIDYGWGHSVYINGVYWGCTPLYVPRIAVGWHTITIFDPWGYCWENDFHVSYYNTVVLNRTIIQPSPSIKSKYKIVREAGYRDPVAAGYTNYVEKTKTVLKRDVTAGKTVTKSAGQSGSIVGSSGKSTRAMAFSPDEVQAPSAKKYARGSTVLNKTDRGYETDLSAGAASKGRSSSVRSNTYRATNNGASDVGEGSRYKSKRDDSPSQGSSGSTGQTSGYYQKKSGSSASRYETRDQRESRSGDESSSSGTYRKSRSSEGSPSGTVKGKSDNNSGSSYRPARKSSDDQSSSSGGSYRKTPAPSKSSSGTVRQSSPAPSKSGSGAVKQSSPAPQKSGNNSGGRSSSSSSSSKGKGKDR